MAFMVNQFMEPVGPLSTKVPTLTQSTPESESGLLVGADSSSLDSLGLTAPQETINPPAMQLVNDSP